MSLDRPPGLVTGLPPRECPWTGLPGRSRGFRPVNVLWTGLPGRSRGDPDRGEPGGLVEAEEDVGALHGLAGGALDQIVEGGQHEHVAGPLVVAGGEVDGVGAPR